MSRGVWGASGCPTSVQKEALIAGPGPEPDVAELAATITLYRHPGLKPEMVVVFEAPEILAEKIVKKSFYRSNKHYFQMARPPSMQAQLKLTLHTHLDVFCYEFGSHCVECFLALDFNVEGRYLFQSCV